MSRRLSITEAALAHLVDLEVHDGDRKQQTSKLKAAVALLAGHVRMVLSGGLSNLDLTLFQSLTSDNQRKARRSRTRARGGWPDGRRKFGAVSGAIMTVLAQAESEMRMKDIHAAVESILGGSVSRHSVSDYLLTRSKGPRPLFERTARSWYRLLPGRR